MLNDSVGGFTHPESFYIVSDNLFGDYNESTRSWNGIVGDLVSGVSTNTQLKLSAECSSCRQSFECGGKLFFCRTTHLTRLPQLNLHRKESSDSKSWQFQSKMETFPVSFVWFYVRHTALHVVMTMLSFFSTQESRCSHSTSHHNCWTWEIHRIQQTIHGPGACGLHGQTTTGRRYDSLLGALFPGSVDVFSPRVFGHFCDNHTVYVSKCLWHTVLAFHQMHCMPKSKFKEKNYVLCSCLEQQFLSLLSAMQVRTTGADVELRLKPRVENLE